MVKTRTLSDPEVVMAEFRTVGTREGARSEERPPPFPDLLRGLLRG